MKPGFRRSVRPAPAANDETPHANGLSNHILPVSATMVGVCMTVISLMQFLSSASKLKWLDDVIAADSLIFMGSAILSYASIRTTANTERLERQADVLFIVGLAVMVGVNFLLAFDLFEH